MDIMRQVFFDIGCL